MMCESYLKKVNDKSVPPANKYYGATVSSYIDPKYFIELWLCGASIILFHLTYVAL